jgi:hypothetical protein
VTATHDIISSELEPTLVNPPPPRAPSLMPERMVQTWIVFCTGTLLLVAAAGVLAVAVVVVLLLVGAVEFVAHWAL